MITLIRMCLVIFLAMNLGFSVEKNETEKLKTSVLAIDSGKVDSGVVDHPHPEPDINTSEDTTVLLSDSVDREAFSPDSEQTVAEEETGGLTDKIDYDTSAFDSTQLENLSLDTSSRVWDNPFWGFGMGWSLGSMPVYAMWRSGLPTGISDVTELSSSLIDSLGLRYIVNNDPGQYIVNFPLSISYSPILRNQNYLTMKLIISMLNKRYEAIVKPDTGQVYWSTERQLTFASLSLGIFLNYSIPDEFFKIKNIERVCFSFGLTGTPLSHLRNRMQTTFLKAKRIDLKTYISAYGIGISWYLGLSTLRRLAEANGLEAGAIYQGSWNGRFMHDKHHLKNQDINVSHSNPEEVLQFVSHRFILYFDILVGKKKKETETSEDEK